MRQDRVAGRAPRAHTSIIGTQVSSGRDVERMSVVKLRHQKAGDDVAEKPTSALRGEKLSELSVTGPQRRTRVRRIRRAHRSRGARLGRWVAAILIVVALIWLAVLFLPGLLNRLVGDLLGFLLDLAG